jgi:hypothetical protein
LAGWPLLATLDAAPSTGFDSEISYVMDLGFNVDVDLINSLKHPVFVRFLPCAFVPGFFVGGPDSPSSVAFFFTESPVQTPPA